MTVVTRFTYGDGSVTEVVVVDGDSCVEITHSMNASAQKDLVVEDSFAELPEENLNPMAEERLTSAFAAEEEMFSPAYEGFSEEENLNPMAEENLTDAYAEGHSSGAAASSRKTRAVGGAVRGVYTALFSLLGMFGAAFAYLQDNLGQLTDFTWQTVLVVVGGAVLAGLLYGLKKYWKPDGLL